MDANMLSRHGISEATYTKILDHQQQSCAICGYKRTNSRKLRVDHSPAGHIRGLLCDKCHDFLIRIGQNPTVCRRAETYLANPPTYSLLGKVGKWTTSRKRALSKTSQALQPIRIVRETTTAGGTIVRIVEDGYESHLSKNTPIFPGS